MIERRRKWGMLCSGMPSSRCLTRQSAGYVPEPPHNRPSQAPLSIWANDIQYAEAAIEVGNRRLFRLKVGMPPEVAGPEGFEPSTIPRTSLRTVPVLQVKSFSHELPAALPG